MLNFRTIFRSLVLGAAIVGTVGTPAISHAGIFISVGPPAPPYYARPILPGSGYIWVDGYYAWGDDGYYWVPGYWSLPPYEGAIWQPGIWGYGGGGWGWTAGFWGHPAGYFGGVYYSSPWPWVGAYGVYHEGWYRNSFYGRDYYNGWYNQRWGREHGREFDDHRYQQARSFEGRYNGGNVSHGAFGENRSGGVNANHGGENHAVFNGPVQHAGENRGGITANRSGNSTYNNPQTSRGQTYASRSAYSNYQGGQSNTARSAYSNPQTTRGSYSGNNAYRPQQSYNGGSQHYSAPQQQHYSAPQQQHYSAPQQQHYSAPQQHYSASQTQRSSGGGGGGSRGNSGGGGHGRR